MSLKRMMDYKTPSEDAKTIQYQYAKIQNTIKEALQNSMWLEAGEEITLTETEERIAEGSFTNKELSNELMVDVCILSLWLQDNKTGRRQKH